MTDPIDRDAIYERIDALVQLNGGPAATARLCEIALPTLECWYHRTNLPNSVGLALLARGCKVSAHWILFGRDAQKNRVPHG